MQALQNREIRLVSRPAGWPEPANFELVEVPLREPADGEVLVRNTHMSLDPYMRGRMRDTKSYVPPFAIGEVLTGAAVGFVVASRDAAVAPGSWVLHDRGWREYALGPAKSFQPIDPSQAPPSAFLGVLGMPGLTAFVGLYDIGAFKPSDVVFVSSAAGAVGSLAGQLAKVKGATVIGSAGSAAKAAYLKEELGFDGAFNYKDGDISKRLNELAPNGIDLYFDNVISQYNEATHGPKNLAMIVGKRLTMRGFIIIDHFTRIGDFVAEVAPLLQSGRVKFPESFVDGLENAPQAFIDLLRGGKYLGKVVVRCAPEGTAP